MVQKLKFICFSIFIILLIPNTIFCQDVAYPNKFLKLDIDELLERIDRLEKNISDLQKGKVENLEKSLSSGYISRNESKLDDFDTKIRANFGLIEEIDNKIQNLDEKVNLIDKEFQSRITNLEKRLEKIEKFSKSKDSLIEKNINRPEIPEQKEVEINDKTKNLVQKHESKKNNILNEGEIKKKYENAIKLLWANKYEEAEKELLELKNIEPADLMPNIQYWLGEVYYAKKNFQQAVIEFGDGFKNYPDSIKGPDNLLKLGLSFSNLKKKDEACNAFYELEIKYKNSPKNVLERSQEERKKINCPKE